MDPALRIQRGQQYLTPEQEAETWRFAEARIAAQLSTEPVDEPETERLLQQAYAVAGLPPPQHIIWLDGPVPLVALRTPESVRGRVEESVWDRVGVGRWVRVTDSTFAMVGGMYASVWASMYASVGDGFSELEAWVYQDVGARLEKSVETSLGASVEASVRDSVGASVEASVRDSVRAYFEAPELAVWRFFDEYLAPNALQALAHFNERVSGYWLGQDTAFLVRRPILLLRDHEGRLHSPSGKCLAYPDGWGFYAWHGVLVPERVILAPARLSREDFLSAPNVEVRRAIQERMGERFVSELGGQVIDSGPRGTLYEVVLPEVDSDDDSNNDPERVARSVQVQDASTARQYCLWVPPTIQTAAEAVAWTFQVAAEDYHPMQET